MDRLRAFLAGAVATVGLLVCSPFCPALGPVAPLAPGTLLPALVAAVARKWMFYDERPAMMPAALCALVATILGQSCDIFLCAEQIDDSLGGAVLPMAEKGVVSMVVLAVTSALFRVRNAFKANLFAVLIICFIAGSSLAVWISQNRLALSLAAETMNSIEGDAVVAIDYPIEPEMLRIASCSYVFTGIGTLILTYYLFIRRQGPSMALTALQEAVFPVLGCVVGLMCFGFIGFWTGCALAPALAMAVFFGTLFVCRRGRFDPFLLPDADARLTDWNVVVSDKAACEVAQGVHAKLEEIGAGMKVVVRADMLVEDTLMTVKERNPGHKVRAEQRHDLRLKPCRVCPGMTSANPRFGSWMGLFLTQRHRDAEKSGFFYRVRSLMTFPSREIAASCEKVKNV